MSSIPLTLLLVLLLASGGLSWGKNVVTSAEDLWSLKPVERHAVPQSATRSQNPIDAFLAETWKEKRLKPVGLSDKLTWLRRVALDLTGLPPTIAEQEDFIADDSSLAYERVVDRLLASEQHGVRYGRHWLDALRYADADENMPAAPGIHLWRNWVIAAINNDLPYDEFARAQILGNRAAKRTIISAEGHLTRVPPRPEDLFALGFLARGATSMENGDHGLAFAATETISTTFMGMTVSCAKCHDHFYDPIKERDFYSMKALFDSLQLSRVDLATTEQLFEQGRRVQEYETRLNTVVEAMRKFIEPHHTRLYEERVSSFPPEVQAAIRKPEGQRNAAEQKIYEDYYPILRIDPPKLKQVMTPEEIRRYDEYLRQIKALKPPPGLPVFWTVVEDAKRAAETNYVLTTGDPARPRKNLPVKPGFPFAPSALEFREGRREAFVDWLTAPENPLFARVAVNRIWQWHFGTGLTPSANDFGALGGTPIHPRLLDWLASEFAQQKFSMKWLHRLIATSEAYRRASAGTPEEEAANHAIDPDNRLFWKFPLRRLEAEPVRDAMLAAAGTLDLAVGGESFDAVQSETGSRRRTAYMSRGYRSYMNSMPDFLQTFDADDGRAVCARRNQTVTAPQALWMMNSELADAVAGEFAERLKRESVGDLAGMIDLGYRFALGRRPTATERASSSAYLETDLSRVKGFAWLLFNLDEFIYVR